MGSLNRMTVVVKDNGFGIKNIIIDEPKTYNSLSFKNIKENYVFTVNHISLAQVEEAHHTIAKYDENVSEFDFGESSDSTRKLKMCL